MQSLYYYLLSIIYYYGLWFRIRDIDANYFEILFLPPCHSRLLTGWTNGCATNKPFFWMYIIDTPVPLASPSPSLIRSPFYMLCYNYSCFSLMLQGNQRIQLTIVLAQKQFVHDLTSQSRRKINQQPISFLKMLSKRKYAWISDSASKGGGCTQIRKCTIKHLH